MHRSKEAQVVEYRIDISPEQAGVSLARQISLEEYNRTLYDSDVDDKPTQKEELVAHTIGGSVNLLEIYNAAFVDSKIVDVGYRAGNGSYMRAIVASADVLQVFFPAHVDAARPYKRDIYSQNDVVGFMADQDFVDARNSGVILESGISQNGSHHIAFPIDFQMPAGEGRKII